MLTHPSLASFRSPISPKRLVVDQPVGQHTTMEGSTEGMADRKEEDSRANRSWEVEGNKVVDRTDWEASDVVQDSKVEVDYMGAAMVDFGNHIDMEGNSDEVEGPIVVKIIG